MRIFEDIKKIKGIGDKTAALFQKLNICTVEDLLNYYPRTYVSYEEPRLISQSKLDTMVALKISLTSDYNAKKFKSIVVGTVYGRDSSGRIKLTFFNAPYLKSRLRRGSCYVFYGKLISNRDELTMEQPSVYTLAEYEELRSSLQPVYSLTKGLSNKLLQKAVKTAMEEAGYQYLYQEYLPKAVLDEFGLISRVEAYKGIHFPDDSKMLSKSRRRLAFDELFLFLWILKESRKGIVKQKSAYPMLEVSEVSRLIERLPYRLTQGQVLAFEDIKADLCSGYEMNRLIQGDVGSGKTILAFLALIMCMANGYQGAMMAPTELLAVQHYNKLQELISDNGLEYEVALLTGSVSSARKREIYDGLESGQIKLAIGTHALIQDKVNFKRLGLVITDEQHRFGVRQRMELSIKGGKPHILVMSATPIPRTLAIVLYGDLSLSIIKDKPAYRLPIKNCVVGTSYRNTAYSFIKRQVDEGRQVYIVCPMVEESEGLVGVENVTDYTQGLKEVFGNKLRIEMLHGKMKPDAKTSIMNSFARHDIDILVSTTVIEVGIDVPNATVMLIENAERFGLSALHQLRGRIGRGEHQSYAIFINGNSNNPDNERLNILNSSNDGFKIAEQDLKIRGAGDLFGIRQSGQLQFELADIYEDSDLILGISAFWDRYFDKDIQFCTKEEENLQEYLDENQYKFIDFRSI